MSGPQQASLAKQLSGLRLAFFEIIWDTFPWIKSIWIKEHKTEFQVFVEAQAKSAKSGTRSDMARAFQGMANIKS
jgi:hypothetical protein